MTEESLFLAALDRPDPADRRKFLDDACAGDSALRQRIDLLLAALAAGRDRLEPPARDDTRTANGPPPTADYQPGPEPGTVIAGRYKLLEKIGAGGMGEVWVARQTEPVTRKVALKLIKPGMDSRQVLARFEAERQALALMDHPNIAKVLDGGVVDSSPHAPREEPGLGPGSGAAPPQGAARAPHAEREGYYGRPYFVMELVNGRPITEFCDAARLTPKERLELFVPVCQAVQHAHQKGVIHRDLKPSNVLVTLYDGKPVPKVIDFGVAKATGGKLTDESVSTQFGAVIGTFEYMAPEQAGLSALDVDTRADVYALGVVLYELLTGLRPFDGQRLRRAAIDELFRILREEDPPRPSTKLSTDASLPSAAAVRGTDPKRLTALMKGELDWIVMKCLEKDRTRRYETASGLARDVQRYLSDEPVEARPPSAGYRARKFLRRNRGPVAAAGILAAAAVLAVAGLATGLVQARRAEADTLLAMGRVRAEEQNSRRALAEAERQRRAAETHAASITVDQDLELCAQGPRELGLLRLARTLATLPSHATALREAVTVAVFCHGQTIWPLLPLATTDGFLPEGFDLSPDGRTLLTVEPGGLYRLWDALTHRPFAAIPAGEQVDWRVFTGTGRVASVGPDGRVVRLWDAAGRPAMTSAPLPGRVDRIAVGPDAGRVLVIADPKPPPASGSEAGTWVELLDGATGRRVARLVGHTARVRFAAFSPDGRLLLTGGDDGTPRVWSAADGRLSFTLPAHTNSVTWVGFSPDGTHAATLAGELHWWPVPDARPRDPAGELHVDSSGRPYETALGFIHPDVLCSAQAMDFVGPTPRTYRRPAATPVSVSGVASDGTLVLSPAGEVYDLNAAGRRLLPPPGRRYHPEAVRLNRGRRLLLGRGLEGQSWVLDLVVEKPVGPADDYRRVVADGVAGVSSGVLVPAVDIALPPDLVELWAQVTVRGELGPDGAVVPWDEPTWERKRQELAARARPVGAFPFPGEVARDRLYWLRQQAFGAGIRAEAVPLLERLAASEPTAEHHARLAWARYKNDQLEAAIRDALAAERRAGPDRWKGVGRAAPILINDLTWDILRRSDRSAEAYQFVLRLADTIDVGPSEEASTAQRLRALTAYRLGRYTEAIAFGTHDEARRAGTCAALLASPWAAAAVPGLSYPPALDIEVVKAMAEYRLGRTEAARARLARARWLDREFGRNPNWVRGPSDQELLQEAEDLLSGRGK